jgi:hypothetical protein
MMPSPTIGTEDFIFAAATVLRWNGSGCIMAKYFAGKNSRFDALLLTC